MIAWCDVRFTPEQCRDFTIRKEIVWQSETVTGRALVQRAKGYALPEAYRRAWPRFWASETEYERRQQRGRRALNGEWSARRWALRIASLLF